MNFRWTWFPIWIVAALFGWWLGGVLLDAEEIRIKRIVQQEKCKGNDSEGGAR
jgi:hypothetical protein